ncbi:hypothetical protein [Streptomyces mirabilis]|uniref:hypothetical protein n=1 Tax=Streptomyces mirabilis TaxID=68239 RepID=UPI00369CCD72
MAAHILPGQHVGTPAGARAKKHNRRPGAPPRSPSPASALTEAPSTYPDQSIHVTLSP